MTTELYRRVRTPCRSAAALDAGASMAPAEVDGKPLRRA
jgi:hypothetical protein